MDISFALPILVTGIGFYLLIKLRAFFIRHPINTARIFLKELGNRDSRRSLMLALAGTLGVGNIFGVAAGIIVGGAGSVFWLAVSALFAMIIKYAEVVLTLDNASEKGGGMHYVFSAVFPRLGKVVSVIFAALCLMLSFFMGAAIQSAAVADVASSALNISPPISVLILCAFLLPCVLGGRRKIENITEIVIPVTTLIYILMSFLVIILNFSKLPSVIYGIASSAFSARAAGGGIIAVLFSKALSEGYARGILSNEAGVGTSAMAHSLKSDRAPSAAGLFGMCEVFFDTLILCVLTALVILLSVPSPQSFGTPMSLVTEAFVSSLGKWSGAVLLLCIFAFAYSTVICWYYYGGECAKYLFPEISKFLFPIAYFSFLSLGTKEVAPIIKITDIIILLMSFPTLCAIFKESNKIKKLTQKGNLLPPL